jgi:hypothetical protein
MTKYELELRFKELTLARYNINREEKVTDRDVYFQSYLDGIVWSMIESEKIQEWIDYYEKKLAE